MTHTKFLTVPSQGDVSPSIGPDYDEFGNDPTATGARYGWLGGKQRSSQDEGGLIIMGVRLYDPVIGRFLAVDPIHGGNANPYDYSLQDPINRSDLTGYEEFNMDDGASGVFEDAAAGMEDVVQQEEEEAEAEAADARRARTQRMAAREARIARQDNRAIRVLLDLPRESNTHLR